MKPIIISLLLLLCFVGVAFAGESLFSGKYKTPLEKMQIRKKAGACLIGKYYYKYGDWAMRHLMPEIALTNDEVSLGMRIRI